MLIIFGLFNLLGEYELWMDGGLPFNCQKGFLFTLPKLSVIPAFMINYCQKTTQCNYFL